MALSLDELTTPMTADEVKAAIYAGLAALGVSTSSWKPGAVVRSIVAVVSIVLAAFTVLMAAIAKSGFLELSEGNWLTLVAKYVFGVDREEATFATGQVTIDNAAGGVYVFNPDDLVVLNPTTHKTYRNTAIVNVAALQTGVLVDIEAIEVGSASTSTPGTITAFETTHIGLSVTNASAVVGLDEESDPALRLRCLEKLSALSPNGPAGAYEFVAKGATRADGTLIGVTRVRVTKFSSTGTVVVTVASATGAIAGDPNDPATDLGAINTAIQEKAVPLGVTAVVQTVTAFPIDVTYELWIYTTASMTNAEIQAAVSARLTTFMSSQPIAGNIIPPSGTGYVYQNAIRTTIGATRPEIFTVAVTVPGGDTVIGNTQVPTLGAVTCTAIHQVSP